METSSGGSGLEGVRQRFVSERTARGTFQEEMGSGDGSTTAVLEEEFFVDDAVAAGAAAGVKQLRREPRLPSGRLRIANNYSPPSKVAHPHPIHTLSLFANGLSIPSNRGALSVRIRESYYSQTGLPDPSDGRGLL